MNLDILKPTGILNFTKQDFVYCGDLSKPFFVVVGCSHTTGESVDYTQSWSNQLANMLQMEHLNIGLKGSDLSYQSEKIDILWDVLPNCQFCIWMQTYPVRNRLPFQFLGDFRRRILHHTLWEDPQTLVSLVGYTKRHLNKSILVLNCWGYPDNYLSILESTFRNNLNYWINKNLQLDYGYDNAHSGPKTHLQLAKDLHCYMRSNNLFKINN